MIIILYNNYIVINLTKVRSLFTLSHKSCDCVNRRLTLVRLYLDTIMFRYDFFIDLYF